MKEIKEYLRGRERERERERESIGEETDEVDIKIVHTEV